MEVSVQDNPLAGIFYEFRMWMWENALVVLTCKDNLCWLRKPLGHKLGLSGESMMVFVSCYIYPRSNNVCDCPEGLV